ncbi:flagellar hook protein FlgE [Pseudogemmobacter sonorensis]|uniref:flagellar hook protein FlgE n=1 Tax=Pseudogemmobacter sonorensis TaxID=2989681 RepID=UPI00367C85BC
MSITSAMNAGVSGLTANATRLGTISDNIANSGTYGYKRAVTEFASLVVTGESGAAFYSAGGVRATSLRLVEERGGLIGTSNPLDLAISGRGMLPVTSAAGLDGGSTSMMLTRSGAFRMDADGVVRTETGLVLMGWPAAADGSIPVMPRDAADGLVPVVINANQPIGNPSTRVGLGLNLPADATAAGAAGDILPLAVEYFGNLGTSETLDLSLTPTVPGTGSSNQWTMEIRDSASGGAVIGEYVLTFDDTRGAGGTLLSVTEVSGGAYDPATGSIALTVAGGPLAMTIGRPGETGGISQLSAPFAPNDVTKDGAPVGVLSALEFDRKGNLIATYDSGFTRRLFQIPIVDVPNPNGLTAVNDQAFSVSNKSGAFYLWNAGEGPTGTLEGFAREASTTDVAAELTALIQTQRAYSSNAKVIQTVDEMLQETTNIKR